jgi:spore photoproduct lyase
MLSTNSSTSLASSFSHIYVEKKAKHHEKTLEILGRFKNATIIEIEHYKDVFNQKGQDFRAQKQTPKLILALKEEPFLYEGSQYADGFGFEQFYYTPTMLNCLYDCDYCYLQGMYPSANMVVYVNREDFFKATLPLLDKPLLICTSYDTDLMAVEKLIGENREWINFAQTQKNLHLELRTKSANFSTIADLEPNNQIVIAWTLSPQAIIDSYESKTPPLAKRLASIKEAMDLGWQVRICLDPVIYNEEFEKNYLPFIDEVFTTLACEKIFEVTTGSFRMSSPHLKVLKKMAHTDLAFYPYEVKDQMATYPKDIETKVLHTMETKILSYINKERLRVWKV